MEDVCVSFRFGEEVIFKIYREFSSKYINNLFKIEEEEE